MKKMLLLLFFLPGMAQSQTTFLLDSTYIQNLNPSTHQLEFFYKTRYTYNALWKPTEELWIKWYNNAWSISSLVQTTYDANGNRAEETSLFWEPALNFWAPSIQFQYAYDGPDVEEQVQFSWNQAALSWKKQSKIITIRNPDSNSVEKAFYNWQPTSETWATSIKYVRVYDIDDNLSGEFHYTWDTQTNDFIPNYKIEYIYTENDTLQIKEENFYHWLPALNDWTPSTKRYYATAAVDTLAVEIEYEWDASTTSWDTMWKRQHIYDIHGNLRHVDVSNWQGTWVLLNVIDHFWSQHNLVSSEETNSAGYLIYPNPAEDLLYIDGLQENGFARIYSAQGRLVQSAVLQGAAARINLRDLPAGVYFMELNVGERKVVKQFIRK